MANDTLIITLVSLLTTSIIGLIIKLHIKKCKSSCCESDCTKSKNSRSSLDDIEADNIEVDNIQCKNNIKISEV